MRNFELDTSPANLAYVAATLVAAYLQNRCFVPPNDGPRKGRKAEEDGLIFRLILIFRVLTPYSYALTANYLLHAAYSVARPVRASALCPHPELLNRSTLGWTPLTAACTVMIVGGGVLRIAAYRQLGRNFTYYLQRPSGLNTSGLYAWVQHPSYAGAAMVACGVMPTVTRLDFGAAALAPDWAVPWIGALTAATLGFMVVTIAVGLPTRMMAEEELLRSTFGKEWEDYHRRTCRLLPGIY